MQRQDKVFLRKLERLAGEVAIGAHQAERGEFLDQSIDEIFALAKMEKQGA